MLGKNAVLPQFLDPTGQINEVMANGRRASIHDHHAVGGSVEDKAEMLRDSLSQLRDSLSAASGELDLRGVGGFGMVFGNGVG
jgi:hypothetical protein